MKLSELIKNNDPVLEPCKELLDKFCETKDKDYFYAFSSYLDVIIQDHHIINDIVVDKRNSL